MAIRIISPTDAAAPYCKAAEVFQTLYEQVTGTRLPLESTDDGRSDLVVIGSDAVNDFLMQEMLELRVESLGIRYGTDDYCLYTYRRDTRRVLVLAGGRGRSTLYAVYDYFERYAGCQYFWDGDVLPHADRLPMENIRVVESPRFLYRGQRYFAHRGLRRFQAEHWSLADWQRELDWLVKRRLNLFMLRIGMDDIWQRAFPEDVAYPDGFCTMTGADATEYNDRTDFWTLSYRGKLREQILAYAKTLDLLSPVDCGTMTHWYSRTPEDFLKNRQPDFLVQEKRQYDEFDNGKIFDITKKENMDSYIRLTETMIGQYGEDSTLFHTIGLAERTMYLDDRKNMALKHLVYRRIAEEIHRRYPEGKLLLANWDFIVWWTPEQVQALLLELDPERTIILDYTSCVLDPQLSFQQWDIQGKFPWIFGIFHAYESETELCGPYRVVEERLRLAAADPACQGMILWPEVSHTDILMLEYFVQNAWQPLQQDISGVAADLCRRRYGTYADTMNTCWQALLPLIELGDWLGETRRPREDPAYIRYYPSIYSHEDMWTRLLRFVCSPEAKDPLFLQHYEQKLCRAIPLLPAAAAALRTLAHNPEMLRAPFILRDAVDMARTVLGRCLNYLIMQAVKAGADSRRSGLFLQHYTHLLEIQQALLSLTDDFSIYATLCALQQTADTNPLFETTLKRNIHNSYCSQPAYELIRAVYLDEADDGFAALAGRLSPQQVEQERLRLEQRFLQTPLYTLQPAHPADPQTVLRQAAGAVEALETVWQLPSEGAEL